MGTELRENQEGPWLGTALPLPEALGAGPCYLRRFAYRPRTYGSAAGRPQVRSLMPTGTGLAESPHPGPSRLSALYRSIWPASLDQLWAIYFSIRASDALSAFNSRYSAARSWQCLALSMVHPRFPRRHAAGN